MAKPQLQLQQKGSSFLQQWQTLFFFRLRRRVACVFVVMDLWFALTSDGYGVGRHRYVHADGGEGGLCRPVGPGPDP